MPQTPGGHSLQRSAMSSRFWARGCLDCVRCPPGKCGGSIGQALGVGSATRPPPVKDPRPLRWADVTDLGLWSYPKLRGVHGVVVG
jgi:hypothetical protein